MRTKLIISITLIIIISIVAMLILNNRTEKVDHGDNDLDHDTIISVETALNNYMGETGDFELKFGGNTTLKDINQILVNLLSEIKTGNKTVGPYLFGPNSSKDPTNFRLRLSNGYKLTINKKSQTVTLDASDKDAVITTEN